MRPKWHKDQGAVEPQLDVQYDRNGTPRLIALTCPPKMIGGKGSGNFRKNLDEEFKGRRSVRQIMHDLVKTGFDLRDPEEKLPPWITK
jgi:hypothetical protein